MHIGAIIRERRRLLRMSQAELARASGVSRLTIHAIEKEAADPKMSTVLALATTLSMEIGVTHDEQTMPAGDGRPAQAD